MIRSWFDRARKKLGRRTDAPQLPADADPADLAIEARVRPHTMTSPLRVLALLDAVRYVVERGVPGALVECGVWRGGSVLAMLLKLQQLGVTDREVWLYDTFEGMSEPSARDTSDFDAPARQTWEAAAAAGKRPWGELFSPDAVGQEAVRALLAATGYPAAKLHFVQGGVEQTLPAQTPERISLLRLDTDWYASTRHELEHLYPRLASGGVLIVDDYGHWQGCRAAVDEYFSKGDVPPVLLNRIDYTGRVAVKP